MDRFYFDINYGVRVNGEQVANVMERRDPRPIAKDVPINNAERIVHALNLAARVGNTVDVTA